MIKIFNCTLILGHYFTWYVQNGPKTYQEVTRTNFNKIFSLPSQFWILQYKNFPRIRTENLWAVLGDSYEKQKIPAPRLFRYWKVYNNHFFS